MFTPSVGKARIKVLGVGGGGGNAINNMIQGGLEGVEFIAANTDFQALASNQASSRIQLGMNLTRGLGAGGNPEIGAKATQEDIDRIREAVEGSDMVFITAGLGGGTGTGGAPIIAQVCKDLGALTVAVVTKPFQVEGRLRERHADEGLKALQDVVDTLIAIPNNRLVSMADKRATVLEMFKRADDILYFAVKGISDLILQPGHINLDFADVRAAMQERGLALMGTGIAKGDNRAALAAQQAISSPLLEDISIHGARAALINICAGPDLGMQEFQEAASIIREEVDENAAIFIGTTFDPSIEDEIRVTVIATGIGRMETKQQRTETPQRRPLRRSLTQGIMPDLDYRILEVPTVMRQGTNLDIPYEEPPQQQQGRKRNVLQRLTGTALDDEDLSIPTFIRRQAD